MKNYTNKLYVFFYALILATIIFPAVAEAKDPSSGPKSTRQFIASLLPEIENINNDILAEREQLFVLEEKHKQKKPLSAKEKNYLRDLANRYNLKSPDFNKASTWNTLELRVDIIPPSLAIAQAATESGWGKSRFAKQGNNLFGQSCFVRGCGIAPKTNARAKPKYEVKKYSSVNDSVRSYAKNLNTHAAYEKLRQLRYQARQKNENPKGLTMVNGLTRYSERGKHYINMISGMIRAHHLDKFDKLATV